MTYITDPKTTSDMVFANEKIENDINSILNGTCPFPIAGNNSLLFYGIFGTGKSTYANIFLNDYEKLFGGSDPHIQTVVCEKTQSITTILNQCNQIASFVSFNYSGYHYFIFDEVDNLTEPAQRALKSFLNKNNIICILTTNYIDKIDAGVKSRCTKINFNAASEDVCVNRFKQILTDNKLPMLPDVALSEIYKIYNGDWRQMTPTLLWAAKEYEKILLAA